MLPCTGAQTPTTLHLHLTSASNPSPSPCLPPATKTSSRWSARKVSAKRRPSSNWREMCKSSSMSRSWRSSRRWRRGIGRGRRPRGLWLMRSIKGFRSKVMSWLPGTSTAWRWRNSLRSRSRLNQILLNKSYFKSKSSLKGLKTRLSNFKLPLKLNNWKKKSRNSWKENSS